MILLASVLTAAVDSDTFITTITTPDSGEGIWETEDLQIEWSALNNNTETRTLEDSEVTLEDEQENTYSNVIDLDEAREPGEVTSLEVTNQRGQPIPDTEIEVEQESQGETNDQGLIGVQLPEQKEEFSVSARTEQSTLTQTYQLEEHEAEPKAGKKKTAKKPQES